MDDKQRKDFELWAKKNKLNLTKEGERYCQGIVNVLWDAWQAGQKIQKESNEN